MLINYKFIKYLVLSCYSFIKYISIDYRNNQIYVYLINVKFIRPFLYFLKNHSQLLFCNLVDLTAVDMLSLKCELNYNFCFQSRFRLIYSLISHLFNYRIFVICPVSEDENPWSVSDLYNSANWLERETWDMFGVFFINHPDLRRILTDYGFENFPLRKDFPLSGYLEVRYDDSKKSVVYESLELSQEFRAFDALSPWAQLL